MNDKPRKIVLLGELPIPNGDGLPKFGLRNVRLADGVTLPTTRPAPVQKHLPDGDQTLTLVGASEAFSALAATAEGEPASRLAVDKAQLDTERFNTDRGIIELPAWRFSVVGTHGTLAWPAVDPGAFYRLGELQPSTGIVSATIAPDDHSLHARIIVGGDCGEAKPRYELQADEHASVIVVSMPIVDPAPQATQKSIGACPAIAVSAEGNTTLKAPLGNRVVIDQSGMAARVDRL